MSGPSNRRSVLIIGGGVFCLSSAWHLLKEHNELIVLDHQEQIAPSQDVSKFFRINYIDPERMREVIRSQALWEHDNIFSPFLTCTGRVVAYSAAHSSTLARINQARAELGLPARVNETAQLLQDWFGSTHITST